MAYFEYGHGLPAGQYRRIEIGDAQTARELQEEYTEADIKWSRAPHGSKERKAAKAKVMRIIKRAQKA